METVLGTERERGASAVEYALFIALVALVVTAGLVRVGGGSKSQLSAAGESISGHTTSGGGSGSVGDEPPAGGGGGGGGGGGTTTEPPTTGPTTTAPTTTTAPAPTTTVPGAPAALFDGASAVQVNSNKWQAAGSIVINGADGLPVTSATVTIHVERYQESSNGGSWKTSTITVTTDENGQAHFETPSWRFNGNSPVTTIELTVQSVEAGGDFEWDGQSPSITLQSP